jgi:hypothetical protein
VDIGRWVARRLAHNVRMTSKRGGDGDGPPKQAQEPCARWRKIGAVYVHGCAAACGAKTGPQLRNARATLGHIVCEEHRCERAARAVDIVVVGGATAQMHGHVNVLAALVTHRGRCHAAHEVRAVKGSEGALAADCAVEVRMGRKVSSAHVQSSAAEGGAEARGEARDSWRGVLIAECEARGGS